MSSGAGRDGEATPAHPRARSPGLNPRLEGKVHGLAVLFLFLCVQTSKRIKTGPSLLSCFMRLKHVCAPLPSFLLHAVETRLRARTIRLAQGLRDRVLRKLSLVQGRQLYLGTGYPSVTEIPQ